MTLEKRKKIKAMLDNPASTENEKAICRRILKDNPESPPAFDPEQEKDRWRRQTQSPWGLRDNFFDSLFGGVAGLGKQHAAQRQQAAAQAQRDADISEAVNAKHNRKTAWEMFKQKIYHSKEDRDRAVTLQREAIRNHAQQRLVDLLRKRH